MSSPVSAPTGASFVVINPSGNRTRAVIEPTPYTIGRQADSLTNTIVMAR